MLNYIPYQRLIWILFLFVSQTFYIKTVNAQPLTESEDFFKGLVREDYIIPFKAGEIERWSSIFADHALVLHNRRAMDRGKSAASDFGNAVHSAFDLKTYDVTVTDVRWSGNWAYTVGTYITEFTNKDDGSSLFGEEHGKFFLLWEHQKNGEWKVIVDMGNSNQE